MKKNIAFKTAYYGVMLSIMLIFSYVESLFVIPLPIPGIKLGLANLIAVLLICSKDIPAAVLLNITRIILSGLLFGNVQGMLIGLSGGICSLIIMIILHKIPLFSVFGISMAGGAFHGAGQILAAAFLLGSPGVIIYLPYLAAAGLVTGGLIGALAAAILPRLTILFYNDPKE